jgi:Xaa-Pro aminopeptidase
VSRPAAATLARERFARVQTIMARRNVGALLLATPHLALFASGARRVQVAGSGGTVPTVVVTAGAPAPVVFTTDPDGAPPWVPRAAIEPLRWDRERQLARIAELVAPTRGAVACDVHAPSLRPFFEGLGRELVDATPLLAEAAAPRTAGEIAAITAALAAARTGLGAAAGAVRAGATPADLVAAFAETLTAARSGFPLGEGFVWRAGPGFTRVASGEACAAGELLALEFGIYLDGHAGIAGVTIVCEGSLEPARRRRWFTALCAIARQCRPGRSTAAVRDAARAAGATQLGLLAHGLGVGIEPPLVDLQMDDDQPFRAGSVLVLAPVVDGVRATRALLVRDGAARWLEPAP